MRPNPPKLFHAEKLGLVSYEDDHSSKCFALLRGRKDFMATAKVDSVKDKPAKVTAKLPTSQPSKGVDPVGNKSPKAAAGLVKPNRVSSGVDIKQLLESGAHFGHKTSRWHPKMAPYIHSKRDGAHIIDLTKTVEALDEALAFLTKTTAEGKQVLLVGTKRQAKDIITQLAKETNMPYVSQRWIGGMLTNQKTIGGRVKYLKDLETKLESGQLASKYNKLEVQRFEEEIAAMNILYGGIKDMAARVGAVFIVDVVHESKAVREAPKLGIKTVAIVDTNADPSLIDYPIPANDDAIKTIQLITDYVGQAITAGKAKSKVTSDSKKATEETKATIKTPNLEPETPEPEEVKGNG